MELNQLQGIAVLDQAVEVDPPDQRRDDDNFDRDRVHAIAVSHVQQVLDQPGGDQDHGEHDHEQRNENLYDGRQLIENQSHQGVEVSFAGLHDGFTKIVRHTGPGPRTIMRPQEVKC
ncbi:uncharacterized protein LOC112679906 [Sipha flava]|uniref:Uncharacterized protein LOC112679906 n=1 Tax=Sipha flava TaxID=143950 RepID=A0A2S2R6F8_9HEMI|nr:uncharacterized protein LOC112679906 [Sipha flava]